MAITHTPGAENYLDHPVIEAYLKACEVTAYYGSLKHVLERRATHEQLLTVLVRLNQYLNDEEVASVLQDKYLRSRSSRKGGVTGGSAIAYLGKAAQPEVALLGLSAPVDEVTLKKAYRVAVKLHHPDRGGDLETMKRVNTAFQVLHKLLLDWRLGSAEAVDDNDWSLSMHSANSVVEVGTLVCQHLYKTYLDDFDFVESFRWMVLYRDQHQHVSNTDEGQGRFWIYSQLTKDAAKVATQLAHTEHATVAREALTFAQACSEKGQLLSDPTLDHYRQLLQSAEDIFVGHKKARLIIKHRRQAEAALRLGLINEKRMKGLLKRFDGQEDAESERAKALQTFAQDIAFSPDVSPDLSTPSNRPPQLVNDTQYYESGLRFLAEEQRAEYAWVFYREPDLMRIRRYTHTRVDEIFRFVILRDGLRDLPRLISECYVLATAAKPAKKGGIGKEAAEVLTWLGGLADDEKRQRIEMLGRLHRIAPEAAYGDMQSVTVSLEGLVLSTGPDWRLCISTNHTFFDLLQTPITILKHIENTKSFVAKNEWATIPRETSQRSRKPTQQSSGFWSIVRGWFS